MTSRNPFAVVDRSGVNTLFLAVALIWLIGFSVWFNRFDLPNNPVPRWMLWSAIPYDILDLIDPPVEQGADHWSWFYLLQRIPFISVAVLIWTGAWSLGSLLLRLFRIGLQELERFYFALCLGLSAVSLTMLLLGVCGCLSRWPMLAILMASFATELFHCWRRHRRVNTQKPVTVDRTVTWPQISGAGWIVIVGMSPFVFGQLLGALSPQTDFDVVEYHLGGPKEWFQQGFISRLPHNVYTSFPFLSEMLVLTGMVLYGDWQWGALAGQAAIAGFAPLTGLGLFLAGRRWFSETSGWLATLVYLTSPWTYRISIIAYAEGGLSCYLFAALFAVLLLREQYLTDSSDSQSTSRPSPRVRFHNKDVGLSSVRVPLVASSQPMPLICVEDTGGPKAAATGTRTFGSDNALALLAGLMAGSAMACKYTGAYAVVVPIGILIVWIAARFIRTGCWRQTVFVGLVYSLGVFATIGPWLVKNAVETGNPVYPLAVRALGGKDRTPELDAKWRKAHAARSFATWQSRLEDLPVKVTDVIANNDWHSPLMFGLAPLSLIWCVRRRAQPATKEFVPHSRRPILGIVWLYIAWQFFTWWIFTHLIDRFYVPMFSVVALLAGIGARWCEAPAAQHDNNRGTTIWNCTSSVIIAASMLYNLDVMLRIGGFNAGRHDLFAARDIAVSPRLRWLNEQFESGRLPPDTKILCVGDALMFHARYPYLYNTVFDHSVLEILCAKLDSQNNEMKTATEIRAEFHRLGITHIDVNWAEILRYREPGNYGYTNFVHPDRFTELQRMGVLGPALPLPPAASLAPLDSSRKQQLEQWAPSLITTAAGKSYYISAQVFPVIKQAAQGR